MSINSDRNGRDNDRWCTYIYTHVLNSQERSKKKKQNSHLDVKKTDRCDENRRMSISTFYLMSNCRRCFFHFTKTGIK
jgi:hypothetical protein